MFLTGRPLRQQRDRHYLLLSEGPVLLDLSLLGSLVLLPPALGAQALPGCVSIVTTSLLAEQLRLVHVDPAALRPLAHLRPTGLLRTCSHGVVPSTVNNATAT